MSSWAQQASPDANAVSQGYTNMKTTRPPPPTKSFHGCSRIQDYEILRKLGEGTFGYFSPSHIRYLSYWKLEQLSDILQRSPPGAVTENWRCRCLKKDLDA